MPIYIYINQVNLYYQQPILYNLLAVFIISKFPPLRMASFGVLFFKFILMLKTINSKMNLAF